MKKTLAALAVFAAVPALSHAQLFEPFQNPIVLGGYAYQLTQPETGNRGAFALVSSIGGLKPFADLPLYFGGAGLMVPTSITDITSQFGDFAMVSVPGVTYFPWGNSTGHKGNIAIQAGYAWVVRGEVKDRSSMYVAIGGSIGGSPAYFNYKREKKAWLKRKAVGSDAGPEPANPYDVGN